MQAPGQESAERLLAASQQCRLVQRVRKERRRHDDSRNSAPCNRWQCEHRLPAETVEVMPDTKLLGRLGRKEKGKMSTAADRASGRRSTRRARGTGRG